MKLYIIHREEPKTVGYCKVGISSKPVMRLKDLEYAGGFSVSEYAMFDVPDDKATLFERTIHAHLKDTRCGTSFGGDTEWFRCTFMDALVHVLSVVFNPELCIWDDGAQVYFSDRWDGDTEALMPLDISGLPRQPIEYVQAQTNEAGIDVDICARTYASIKQLMDKLYVAADEIATYVFEFTPKPTTPETQCKH